MKYSMAIGILALAVANGPVQAAPTVINPAVGFDGWFEWTDGLGQIDNIDSGTGYPSTPSTSWTMNLSGYGSFGIDTADIGTPGDEFTLYVDGSAVSWTSTGTGSAYGGFAATGYETSTDFFQASKSLNLSPGDHTFTIYLSALATGINNGEGHIYFSPAELSEVPEPSSVLLFGAGMLGLGWLGRKSVRRS
jgi:hypothetical protein